MRLRHLPADEAAVRRFTEELWLPYNRDLAAAVDSYALATDVDIVGEEGYRAWVAVDGSSGG